MPHVRIETATAAQSCVYPRRFADTGGKRPSPAIDRALGRPCVLPPTAELEENPTSFPIRCSQLGKFPVLTFGNQARSAHG
ncbi:hypothetical protein IscW_ISCW021499 [Ixodes scapularis]|uniref:Uncharacterized protein n=1 Tax=Ixodes scapularis TaxID=6945 RepID=B7Q4Z5_IXOSC|nr:hypothetical protein IscW_ISCW021499 [Ixodes scapularis]|eukprot:XP_002411653.1 hypothetical protein IscW_ISCW021499 [Ixodes scapularis]